MAIGSVLNAGISTLGLETLATAARHRNHFREELVARELLWQVLMAIGHARRVIM
jgi:hypothetical protein